MIRLLAFSSTTNAPKLTRQFDTPPPFYQSIPKSRRTLSCTPAGPVLHPGQTVLTQGRVLDIHTAVRAVSSELLFDPGSRVVLCLSQPNC